MPLTPQDVHSKVFGPTRFRRGYDETEVDAFLDEVEAELTRLHEQINALRSRIEGGGAAGADGHGAGAVDAVPGTTADQAQAAAASLSGVDVSQVDVSGTGVANAGASRADLSGDLEQRVARTLVLAQRAADEALQDAETHAEQVRAAAQADAERVRAESEEAAARERAAVESERSAAEDHVEQLRAFEREYRTRLRAYLELQLRELDGAGSASVESTRPAPALAERDGAVDVEASHDKGGAPGVGGSHDGVGSPGVGGSHDVGGSQGVGGPHDAHGTSAADGYRGHNASAYPGAEGGAPTRDASPSFGGAVPSADVADSAAGGVSQQTAGEEQGHEHPHDRA